MEDRLSWFGPNRIQQSRDWLLVKIRILADFGLFVLVIHLRTSRRLSVLKNDAPVWTRHDRAGRPGAALSSHSFVENLKRYAQEAGIGSIRLHQLRHSFARMVADETGSLSEIQEALGHKHAATTRIYVQRIAIKRDKFSSKIMKKLGLQNPVATYHSE